jgi:exodeoxyribonuclease VII large subunit
MDVVIVGRGGGSVDDLGVFNDEAVVRAVAGCRVPVVSAVGHDIDFTLVDFAADVRAATPSQAAEMVVADGRARGEMLASTLQHMARAMRARLTGDRVTLAHVARGLGDPRLEIANRQQMLDDRMGRLVARMRVKVARRREGLSQVRQRLAYLHPRAVMARERVELGQLGVRLAMAGRGAVQARSELVQRAATRLEALSPLSVLSRGYAIATRADGRLLRSASDVLAGDVVHVRVAHACLDARVEQVEPLEPE